jgi:FKBP-type peptidyl-prolyl cis-trans isomerase
MQATFYIPSTLAYGPQQRSEVITANSILVFDMEVVEIK